LGPVLLKRTFPELIYNSVIAAVQGESKVNKFSRASH
jgi:hypothetical protein